MSTDRLSDDAPLVDRDLEDVRAAQVDRAAFGILYRRYLDPVYGYCFYLLGDHHDAEDATERTFLAALGAIDRFRDEGATFRSWLFRIAHNQLANALRTRNRQRTDPRDLVREPATGGDPARLATLADDARRLRAALGTLPEDRRQVVVLRFVDGLTAREIGVVLRRSEGAVRVLQHRALRDLATLLGTSRSD
ncbi:MAG: sigma-70 family RNA polymerase sigma factor [Chloroflexi bacterium]|nr:sigma-70 family RNA polymerase sigma factor [Chloroflexota bacterium]